MERSGKRIWPVLALLCALIATALWYFVVYAEADGDDLSSSYIGCRVVAAGQSSHLYAHDPKNFAAIGPDAPWQHAAEVGDYQAFLHPYVQTPLWAYSLLPLCRHTTWSQFKWVFAVLAMLSFGGLLTLVATFWTPVFLHPLAMGGVAAVLWFFQPFQYSMMLMQTHIFFVLALVGALIQESRRRPVQAGLLVALAATVKITPGVLIVYWLVRRRWKTALAAALWTVLLWLLTRQVAGPQLMSTYLATLDRISHTVLSSFNNQSFAAWFMDRFYLTRPTSFVPLRLPDTLRLASSAMLLVTAVAGGWLDSHKKSTDGRFLPIGGLIAMLGATVFAPIEWSHYSIVLIAPMMVLVQHYCDTRQGWLPPVIAVVLLLNVLPFAIDPYATTQSQFAILRSHFYSDVVCLLALGLIGARLRLTEPARC